MSSIKVIKEQNGYVLMNEGEKLMALFGDVPLWFENETLATAFSSTYFTPNNELRIAIHSLISNLHFGTGNPMHLNLDTITNLINSDALFYPFSGPERVDQHYYFEPIRNYIEQIGFSWKDLDLSGPYDHEDSLLFAKEVDSLNLIQKSKLLFLTMTTENMFVAALAYLKQQLSDKEFTEACLFNVGLSPKSKSKAQTEFKNLLVGLKEI